MTHLPIKEIRTPEPQLNPPSDTPSLPFPPINMYPPVPSFSNYPFGVGPNYPPSFSQYPVPPRMVPFGQTNPTIKKLLESFLLSSALEEQAMVKVTMYDLMVYIDKNADSLNDPRTRDIVFLSYCDQSDPRFVKPLLQGYIKKMSDESRDAQEETTKVVLQRKIDYLVKLLVWLGEMRLIDFSLKIHLPSKEQEQEVNQFQQ